VLISTQPVRGSVESNVIVEATVDGTERPVTEDALFAATFVQPNSEGIGLNAVGVETNDDGMILVDEYIRTTNPPCTLPAT